MLGYVFLIPSLIVFAAFMFYPLAKTIYLSFFDWNMIKPVKKFVGLANYKLIFADPNTYKNYWKYRGLYSDPAGGELHRAVHLILYPVGGDQKRKNFYKAVFSLPSVISLVVGSILYTWILNPISGPVAIIAKAFGITLPIWSKTEGWVIAVLSVITSWKVFGYNFIVILAGVSGVSTEVIEAARLDDVPNWKIFRDIVVPMSSATGIYVFIITIVQGLQYVFTPIKVVTQGGPNYASSNMIYQSYHEAFTCTAPASSRQYPC